MTKTKSGPAGDDVTVDAEGYALVTQSNRNVLGAPSDQELNFDLGPAMTIVGVDNPGAVRGEMPLEQTRLGLPVIV